MRRESSSFARIFFRNSINIGLPLVEADIGVADGETVEVDFEKGQVTNKATGAKADFPPLPDFLLKLMEAGGLVEYTKHKLDG